MGIDSLKVAFLARHKYVECFLASFAPKEEQVYVLSIHDSTSSQ